MLHMTIPYRIADMAMQLSQIHSAPSGYYAYIPRLLQAHVL